MKSTLNKVELRDDVFRNVVRSNIWSAKNSNITQIFIKGLNIKGIDALKVTPFGCEFIINIDLLNIFEEEALEIVLLINNQSYYFNGFVIFKKTYNTKFLVGVRWIEGNLNHTPLICSSLFLPVGVAASPFDFSDLIIFKVTQINNMGFQITTSLRNKGLVPGMQLNTLLEFPTVGSCSVTVKIKWARVGVYLGEDVLNLWVDFENPNSSALNLFYLFSIEFASKSFFEKNSSEHSTISQNIYFMRTAKDCRDIIELRRDFFDSNQDADTFDINSKDLLVRENDKCIASARVNLPGQQDLIEDSDKMRILASIPRNDELVVFSNIFVQKKVELEKYLNQLVKGVLLAMSSSNRGYILIYSNENYVDYFESLGAQKTNIIYSKRIGEKKINITVLLLNFHKIIAGDGIKRRLWNAIVSEILDKTRNSIELTRLEKIRIFLYRVLKL